MPCWRSSGTVSKAKQRLLFYNAAGTMILKFSSIAGDCTEEYRSETLSAAIAVHDALWQQGDHYPASTAGDRLGLLPVDRRQLHLR